MSLKVNRGRTLARSQALQILFQAEMLGQSVDEVLSGDYLISKGPLADYAVELARGVDANKDRIDSALRAVSANWRLERMPGADRNLLRVAVYELYFLVDDPLDTGIVVNEAVEVAKAYGTDESAGFVNGILGEIAREQVLPTLQRSGCTITADDCEAACIAAMWFEIDPKRVAEREAAAERAAWEAERAASYGDDWDPVEEFEAAMRAKAEAETDEEAAARRARIAALGDDAIDLDAETSFGTFGSAQAAEAE